MDVFVHRSVDESCNASIKIINLITMRPEEEEDKILAPSVGYQRIPLDLIGHSRTLDPIWVDLCT